jgi:hypothetical protein
MILSHRHKYVFIHCRKTGGSALKVSLYRYLGPRDIGVAAWGDAFRNKVRPNLRMAWWALRPPGGARFIGQVLAGRRFGDSFGYSVKQTSDLVFGSGHQLDHHLTAALVKARYPREWSEYFTFCVVRNPYARVVSDYFWRTKNLGENGPSFSEFVKALYTNEDLGGIASAIPDNWNFYTIDDKVAVDHVIRYENLLSEMSTIARDIGLAWDGWIPRAKVSQSSRVDYRDMYDVTARKAVHHMFQREIERFDYSF